MPRPTLQDLHHKIEVIETNHLKHMKDDIDRIEKKVDRMDNRIWWVLGLLVAGVVTIVFKGIV